MSRIFCARLGERALLRVILTFPLLSAALTSCINSASSWLTLSGFDSLPAPTSMLHGLALGPRSCRSSSISALAFFRRSMFFFKFESSFSHVLIPNMPDNLFVRKRSVDRKGEEESAEGMALRVRGMGQDVGFFCEWEVGNKLLIVFFVSVTPVGCSKEHNGSLPLLTTRVSYL